jgi:glycosyltransferase involved in cell wall biosynthesis
MKIVQVMPEFGLAGAETMCENLTYELTKLGHKVTVVSMYDYHSAITDRLEKSGIDVRYLGKKPGLDIAIIPRIKKILKEVSADVVHTHLYCAQYAVPAAMLAGVKHRIHTVHTVAEKENGKLARKLNKFFFKHCHLIPVALSELIRDSIVKEYGINKDKIPVIYNGIDLSKCLPKTDYSIYGNFKILHIGRFSEPKNHVGLLKAFKLFHDNHSDSELWLIGDGEKKIEIERYVAENNLDESVRFLGLQSNVYGYLHDADMFTLPSNYEGIPMTLIEAMGTGLPIVATAVGGIPDMLSNNKNALLVDISFEEIANAFEQYYLDENLRKNHGQHVKERSYMFSSVTMAKEYLKIYN